MNCPRGCTAERFERDRDGVTVDVCPECRGLWLDRGELERLVARARSDFDDDSTWRARDEGRYEQRREKPKKRSWLESLTDLVGD